MKNQFNQTAHEPNSGVQTTGNNHERKRKQVLQQRRKSEQQFREMTDALPEAIYTTDAEGRLTYFNPAAVEFSGRTPELGTDRWCVTWKLYWPDGTPMPYDECPMAVAMKEERSIRGAEAIAERPDGTHIWFEAYPSPLYNDEGKFVGGINMLVDVTDRKRSERLEEEQKELLELIATGCPLEECLSALCEAVPQLNPGVRASILLAGDEGASFHRPIAPDLQPSWGEGLEGAPINDLMIGTCGEAVFRGESVTCEDVASDDRWSKEWRDLCVANGVLAGLSVPIQSTGGEPLGSFMLCFDEPRVPNAWEERLAAFGVHVASIAIERDRSRQALQESKDRLASKVADMERLHALSTRLLGQDEVEAALHEVMTAAAELLRANKASVQIYDEQEDVLRLVSAIGFDQEFADQFQIVEAGGFTTCAAALGRQEQVLVEDLSIAPDFAEFRRAAAPYDVQAAFSTPLCGSDGRLFGVFTIYWEDPHRPAEDELQLLDLYTQQAARQIERKRAEMERRTVATRLRAQKEAFQAAADGAPLEESLSILLRTAVEEAEGDARAAFYIVDDDGSCLHPIARTSDMPEAYTRAVDGFPIGADSLSCGLAAHTGEPILTRDVYEEPLWEPVLHLAEKGEFHGCWSFPTETVAGEVVGSFAIYYREPREATPRDRKLAGIVTQAAAIIISRYKESEERKQAEEALRKSEERHRTLFESVPVAAFVCDRSAVIQHYNRRAAELWGREPKCGDPDERYCGSQKLYLPDGTLLSHSQSPMVEVLRDGTPIHNAEVSIERPDGSRIPVIVNFSPLKDAQGEITGVITTFDDITERKKAEEALKEAKEEAEKAARMRSNLLANMSHEVRTPLTGILGLANSLLRKIPDEHHEEVRLIERSGNRLRDTLNSVLTLAQLEGGELDIDTELLNVTDETEEIANSLRPLAADKGLSLEVQSAAPEAKAHLDPALLGRILNNLVGNAIKFTGEGGITLEVAASNGQVAISVCDTGVGISEEFMPKLFEEFKQESTGLSRLHEGIGLGLVLTKKMVEISGGSIMVESEKGEGSRFTVRFPRAADQTGNDQQYTEHDKEITGGGG